MNSTYTNKMLYKGSTHIVSFVIGRYICIPSHDFVATKVIVTTMDTLSRNRFFVFNFG